MESLVLDFMLPLGRNGCDNQKMQQCVHGDMDAAAVVVNS